MSRTIVQIVAARELRGGDTVHHLNAGTSDTVTEVIHGITAQTAYWSGDDAVLRDLDFSRSVTVDYADRSADILGTDDAVAITPRDRSIVVYRTRWTPEDDGAGGTTEPDYMNDTTEEVIDCEDGADTIDLTILRLTDLGLVGNPEHVDRYEDPDGSKTVDYYTGEREIVSAVLRDFTEDDERLVRYYVPA